MLKKSHYVNFLIFFFILIVFLAFFHFNCEREPFEKSFFALDTVITIKIYDARPDIEKDVRKAIDLLREFEKIANFYDPKSELSRLNSLAERSGCAEGCLVSPKLSDLLEISLALSKETDGAFDFTVGPLMETWGFSDKGRVPEKDALRKALKNVSFKKVELRDNKVFTQKGVKMDFGGVAKGWALDKVSLLLKKKGYENFLLHSVSSTIASGKKNGEPYRIGIKNPRGKGIIAAVRISDGETISTSGDYQKYFTSGNRRYHHILDPKTGYPARKFISVTVVTKRSAAEADALSTAIFVMGPEKGLEFAKKKKLKIIAVDSRRNLIVHPENGWYELAK